jgi:hypothetical protein
MPWTEPLANPDELRHCIRDLIALSTLSAAWRNYDMRQIGDSIVAALITMLAADFVFMALPSHGDQFAELASSDPTLTPASLDYVRRYCGAKKRRSAVSRNLSLPTHPAAETCTWRPRRSG